MLMEGKKQFQLKEISALKVEIAELKSLMRLVIEKGIKEQQEIIETQQAQIDALTKIVMEMKSSMIKTII